jgi:hypothetical protein
MRSAGEFPAGVSFAAGARAALLTLAVLAVCGCTSAGGLFGRGSGTDGGSSGSRAIGGEPLIRLDVQGLGDYLQMMQQLIAADSLTQAGIVSELRDNAEFAPTKQNRLMYALALSVPGHNGADAAEGAERLRTLIASGDTLTREERVLAQIQLQAAEALEVLETASLQFDEQIRQALAARDEENAAALRQARAETEAVRTSLEAELEEAKATLDAITSIERSISEREDDE